jgi:hypothetical protein
MVASFWGVYSAGGGLVPALIVHGGYRPEIRFLPGNAHRFSLKKEVLRTDAINLILVRMVKKGR